MARGGLQMRDRGDDVVTANGLATHLGMSRQNVARLTAEAIITQRADGRYDQSASRLAYIKHLRAEHRRSPRVEADAEFSWAKSELIRIRIAEKQGELIALEEAERVVDGVVGLCIMKMNELPARIGRTDLSLRRQIEAAVFETRVAIADVAQSLAQPPTSGDEAA